MTTPVATSRSTYTGNAATTVFSTGFYFLAESHVVVKLTLSGGTEIVQTLGVHYTLTMPLTVGAVGSVTMLTAPATASTLVIERTVPYTQDTSFRTQGSFSPATHEDVNDYSRHVDQQLARRVSDLESAGAVGSVVAGNGLSFSGTTLHVGAGTGIQANADTVEVLFGAAADVADVTKAAESAGVGVTAARIDHKHDVSTAAPAAGAVAIGNAAGEGTATSLSRSDHVHAVIAPAAPADVTKAAAAAGAATTFARADHKHDVTTAAAIDLTDSTNAEGAATTLARSNHTHSHGARGGGTLHANAVAAGAAGFMTGADKTILDALAATKSHVRATTTAGQAIPDAVATTIIYGTEIEDTLNEYVAATGIFTAGLAGYYLVTAKIASSSVAQVVGASLSLSILKNGAAFATGLTEIPETTTIRTVCADISTVIKLAAADNVRLQATSNGLARALNTNAYECWMTIDRID